MTTQRSEEQRRAERKLAERKRVGAIICRAYTKEEILAAQFANGEYWRRYPDDWDLLEMGGMLSHREDYNREQEIAAAIAAGKDPNYVSPEQKRFDHVLRHLFSGRGNPEALLEDYKRAIPKIQAIRFRTVGEQREADHFLGDLRESIARIEQELIDDRL